MKVLLIGAGYVGSYLAKTLIEAGHDLSICNESSPAADVPINLVGQRYQDLTDQDLAPFDAILWFAGHSSVPSSIRDPEGALSNNCLDLLALARRKRLETRLIYASTGSVYSVQQVDPSIAPPVLTENETRLNPVNPYDCSKLAFDAIASCFTTNTVGLRLGTVCGYSPRVRPELIFNAMNLSAMRDGVVNVSNPHAHRSILFLEDLDYYVQHLLKHKNPLPRILNVASYNITVGELAVLISDFHDARISYGADSVTYSFCMNTDMVKSICGSPHQQSIQSQCDEFSRSIRAEMQHS